MKSQTSLFKGTRPSREPGYSSHHIASGRADVFERLQIWRAPLRVDVSDRLQILLADLTPGRCAVLGVKSQQRPIPARHQTQIKWLQLQPKTGSQRQASPSGWSQSGVHLACMDVSNRRRRAAARAAICPYQRTLGMAGSLHSRHSVLCQSQALCAGGRYSLRVHFSGLENQRCVLGGLGLRV
jgi:hypothetical protein